MGDKEKVSRVVSLALSSLLLTVPLHAHHGTNISYDRDATIAVTGVVTNFRLINPHPALFIDVTNDDGSVTNWAIEIAPTPYTLALRGWNKRRSEEALKPGTVLNLTMAPARAGTPVALLRTIVNEEGTEIFGEDLDGVSVGRDLNEQ